MFAIRSLTLEHVLAIRHKDGCGRRGLREVYGLLPVGFFVHTWSFVILEQQYPTYPLHTSVFLISAEQDGRYS